MTLQQNYSDSPEWKLQKARHRTKKRKAEENPIWQPSQENAPQQMAYDLALSGDVMEIGYGGQAGGGKTDLALGLAGTVFNKSLILRREFPMLSDVIERGNEIYPDSFVGGSKKHWRFDGRLIALASMQYEDDWKKFQGRSIGLLAFDESAEFLESQVRNVSGWIRSPKGRNTLLFLSFNPPTTPEGEWIVERFAPWIDESYPGTKAVPGEIRWFANIDDKEVEVDSGDTFVKDDGTTAYPISRTFIPASRHDNPHLGEEYERRIDNLPEPLRTMVKDGDFTVGTKDDIWQVIPTLWILQAVERGRNTPKPDLKLRAIGCDPSAGGDDETVIPKLYGNWFEVHSYPGSEMVDGPAVANKVLEHMESPAPIYIDNIGVGRSPWDHLKVLRHIDITPIVHSAGTKETDKDGVIGFGNVRAAAYWKFREALNPASGENICLPDNRKIRVDLSTPRYKIQGGKYYIEPKKDIKKRTGRSPDYGDAIVDTWYGCNQPKTGLVDLSELDGYGRW